MKNLILVTLLFGAAAAIPAYAAPVNYTLSSVSFSGGKTLSGTFTYDSDTNTYSSVNLSYFDGTTTNTVSTVHLSSSTRLIASSGGNGTPGVDLVSFSPALSNSGGTSSYTAYVGTYNGSNLSSSVSAAATLSGTAAAGIPTLSGWALIVFAMLMGGAMLWYQRPAASRKF